MYISFLEKIKTFFKENLQYPRIYFGKSTKSVPSGALIFFPVQDNQLNCGLTGIVTLKKSKIAAPKIPMHKAESMILHLKAYTYKKIQEEKGGLTENYLGGEAFIKELQDLIGNLRITSSLYTIFKETAVREKLAGASLNLEKIINEEENEHRQRLSFLSFEENEIIIKRISLLKDIHWPLKEEILNNLEKIEGLSRSTDKDMPQLVFKQLKNINVLFNNLDRLEVRGRDSAGISVIAIVEKKDYLLFEKELAKRSLLDEFSSRLKEEILLNKNITINIREDNVSIAFTYKIAAQIGHLGDNVKFLRKQIQDDSIFQSFITLPSIYQTIFAHTRWASVGEISEPNCHPIDNLILHNYREDEPNDRTGIIHVCLNGDIDNYSVLKEEYEKETKKSIPTQITTDTKIIPLQIQKYYDMGHPIEESLRLAVNDFTGSHAIAMHTDLAPGKIFLAQRGSGQTIYIGLGKEHYITASEIYGLVEETSRYIKLEGEKTGNGLEGKNRGQIFIMDQDSSGELDGIRACYYNGDPIKLTEDNIKHTEITSRDIDRQHFPHYFMKEISESPASVENTLLNKWQIVQKHGKNYPLVLLDDQTMPPSIITAFTQNRIKRILFIGQGTAGIAALGCARILGYYLAGSGIHVAPLKASEFSGGLFNTNLKDTLIIAITQSGTTTDTNMAIDMAKEHGAYTMAIVNRRDSDITFKVDGVLHTSTGRDVEMSVASTKAYYSQIAAGSILGLKLAQLISLRDDDFIFGEIQRLMKLPFLMKKVLSMDKEIAASAYKFAPTKKYWAVVGSGYNKIAADEIRIKLSELCYKTISSDVVEDKKHIDLSSEPLIVICAAGSRGNVINDIIKDTAIFKAHQATTIVIATEGQEGFKPYADSLIYLPEIAEHFSPILTTLTGHLWGYHAAMAINEGSRFLFDFREEVNRYISECFENGLDIYQTILNKSFQEKTARFFSHFKKRLDDRRYTTAMELKAASDLTLLLKYLSGRLPMADFELDFDVSGTAPNMFEIFFRCIGEAIDDMARPIDAIRHQAKTVTVGTSRIWEQIDGLLFETAKKSGFDVSNLTNKNVLVLKNLQEIISTIKGETLYKISNLSYAGEPVDGSNIELVKKGGSAANLPSRVESDNRLMGTKRIIVKAGNVFIGKGRIDNRSILVVPLMKIGPNIDHLLLLNIGFREEIDVAKKIKALGDKFPHIKNIVEETGLAWKDDYINLLKAEDLFGNSAEKIAEFIISATSASKS
ncbi:MAG TPA: SIS domain-containing protein [Desulfatiglandales bacterium]|nr:SIS domain-containing protein [Desulfatiglandales bacterium]